MSEATRLLPQMQAGETAAADKMLGLVYGELRQIAARLMERERLNHAAPAA